MRFPAPPRETYNYSNRIFYGNRHQYRYYPAAFVLNGINYNAGYYDEEGTYYNNLEMKDDLGNTVRYLTCEYCGCQAEYKPSDGAIPKCTHCGAPLTIKDIAKDTEYKEVKNNYSTGTVNTKKKKRWPIFVAIFVLVCIIFSQCGKNKIPDTNPNPGGTTITTQTNKFNGETIYLKGDGQSYTVSDQKDYNKKLIWDKEYDSYYDQASECWLWYNRDVSPAVWQYWFEGVSSDYGDFGWMEYDDGDGNWYIEVSDGNWQKYTGNTSKLWHIS